MRRLAQNREAARKSRMRKKVIFICFVIYNMLISLFDSDRAVRKMDLFSYYTLGKTFVFPSKSHLAKRCD